MLKGPLYTFLHIFVVHLPIYIVIEKSNYHKDNLYNNRKVIFENIQRGFIRALTFRLFKLLKYALQIMKGSNNLLIMVSRLYPRNCIALIVFLL